MLSILALLCNYDQENCLINVGTEGALDFWHTGANGHIRSTAGSVIVESPFETKSSSVLGGDTFIDGVLRTRPATPQANSRCTAGQIAWDADYIYVCTATDIWKRASLAPY